MESLELRIDSDLANTLDRGIALRDTCRMAIDSASMGLKVERLNYHEGVPSIIIIMATTEKITQENIRSYVKKHLPWYKFTS